MTSRLLEPPVTLAAGGRGHLDSAVTAAEAGGAESQTAPTEAVPAAVLAAVPAAAFHVDPVGTLRVLTLTNRRKRTLDRAPTPDRIVSW